MGDNNAMVDILVSDDGPLQEVLTLFRTASLGLCKNGSATPSFANDRAGMALFQDVVRLAQQLHQRNPWAFLGAGMTFRLRLDSNEAVQEPRPNLGDLPSSPLDFYFHLFTIENTVDSSLNPSPKFAAPCVGLRGKMMGVPGIIQLAYVPLEVIGHEATELINRQNTYFPPLGLYPDVSVWNKFTTSFPSSVQMGWLHSVLHSVLGVLTSNDGATLNELRTAIAQEQKEQVPLKTLMTGQASFAKIIQDTRVPAKHTQHTISFPAFASFPEDTIAPYECIACHKPLQRKNIKCCAGCHAVIYCSAECQRENWKACHQWDCAPYKRYMQEREPILRVSSAQFDFPTAIARGGWHTWLDVFGVREKGMWKRQCGCSDSVRFGQLFEPDLDDDSLWALPPGCYPPPTPIPPFIINYPSPYIPPSFLASWTDYYRARNLPANSPVAILLSFPMSLYYIIGMLAHRGKVSLHPGARINIHYLGVEKEMDMLTSFRELMYLIPGVHLTLDMVGPMIGKFCSYFEPRTLVEIKNPEDDRETVTYENRVMTDPHGGGSITFVFHQAMYQEAYATIPRQPDVVVGLNAGIEAYTAWLDVINVVATNKLTAYFTDYCEASCFNSELALQNQNLPLSCRTHINPFGSPICRKSANNFMPAMTNGFVFGVN